MQTWTMPKLFLNWHYGYLRHLSQTYQVILGNLLTKPTHRGTRNVFVSLCKCTCTHTQKWRFVGKVYWIPSIKLHPSSTLSDCSTFRSHVMQTLSGHSPLTWETSVRLKGCGRAHISWKVVKLDLQLASWHEHEWDHVTSLSSADLLKVSMVANRNYINLILSS